MVSERKVLIHRTRRVRERGDDGMKGFARVTKLSNIGGRADYISNPDRQESIVAASASVDWKPYQDFEMANQKTEKRNNEGREVVIALPNEWAALSRDELNRRAEKIAVTAAGKDTDLQWAVHWNKARTNLHIHVIFSERQREKNPGRWDRDIYLTADGKVARRKADRAKNEDGSIKPPVHRKGDMKDGFTAKDPQYKKRSWVPSMKQQLQDQFAAMGVVLEKPQPLHEYHEGRGKGAAAIRTKNELIRANNAQMKEIFPASFPAVTEATRELFLDAVKEGKVAHMLRFEGAPALVCVALETHKKVAGLKAALKSVEENFDRYSQIQQQLDRLRLHQLSERHRLKKKADAAQAAIGEAREKLIELSRPYRYDAIQSKYMDLPGMEMPRAAVKEVIEKMLLTPENIKEIRDRRAFVAAKKAAQEKNQEQPKEQFKADPQRRSSPQPTRTKTKSRSDRDDR